MEFFKIGEKDDRIRLSDGSGSAWFEVLEMAAVNGREYAALLQQGEEEPVILRLGESENGGESYFSVEDDAEFDKVCAMLEAAMDDT